MSLLYSSSVIGRKCITRWSWALSLVEAVLTFRKRKRWITWVATASLSIWPHESSFTRKSFPKRCLGAWERRSRRVVRSAERCHVRRWEIRTTLSCGVEWTESNGSAIEPQTWSSTSHKSSATSAPSSLYIRLTSSSRAHLQVWDPFELVMWSSVALLRSSAWSLKWNQGNWCRRYRQSSLI